jgi:hypothetical protein
MKAMFGLAAWPEYSLTDTVLQCGVDGSRATASEAYKSPDSGAAPITKYQVTLLKKEL